jgi:hypothetical protein
MTSTPVSLAQELPQQRRLADAPIVSRLGPEPWNEPWWKTAKGDQATFFYIIAIHVLALIGLIFFVQPGWKVMVSAVALGWLGGLGVTVCYHRALAHTALRLNPVVKHCLIFFAMFNGSGSPDSWTANHRQHHARVETTEDISSPAIGGFWWAHLRWLWQAGNVPLDRWCPDLDKGEYRFWRRMQIPLLAVSLFGGLAFGVLLARADATGRVPARAVLHQQHRPHARGARARPGLFSEHRLARAAALLPGRELASQPSREALLGTPRMDVVADRFRLVRDRAAGSGWPREVGQAPVLNRETPRSKRCPALLTLRRKHSRSRTRLRKLTARRPLRRSSKLAAIRLRVLTAAGSGRLSTGMRRMRSPWRGGKLERVNGGG